jgi:hypothetical protein
MKYAADGLCKPFGVTKQAYYKYDEQEVLVKVAREEFVLQWGCLKSKTPLLFILSYPLNSVT